jgi:hypothetical protein
MRSSRRISKFKYKIQRARWWLYGNSLLIINIYAMSQHTGKGATSATGGTGAGTGGTGTGG